MKIKTGDKVIVLTGKDKGKTGKVVKVLRDEDRVVVENINMRKKHKRGSADILEFAAPMHVSNVSLVDPKTNKPTRVGYKMVGDKKVRVAAKSGNEIK